MLKELEHKGGAEKDILIKAAFNCYLVLKRLKIDVYYEKFGDIAGYPQ